MSTLVTTALRHNTSISNNIILDSNGRVGIGTAAPGARLDVVESTSIQARFKSPTGGTAQIASYAGGCEFSSNDSSVIYGTSAPSGITTFWAGNAERMRIDASGRVTMPGKPMFMGFPTNDYSGGSMPTGVLPFTASYNNGSHYNSGTSRFTAPVTGWYRVTWGGLQLGGTVTSLQVNGVRTYNGNHYVNGASYVNMTQTVLRTLNAGDFLTIEGWNGGGYYRDWYLWTVELVA